MYYVKFTVSQQLPIIDQHYYNSIINTKRSINEIKIAMKAIGFLVTPTAYPKEQMDRIVLLFRTFAPSITSLTWNYLKFTVDDAIEILQSLPNLENLTLNFGSIDGPAPKKVKASTLPKLKTLEIMMVAGFYNVATLLPANTLINCSICTADETAAVVRSFLLKQRNVKLLKIYHQMEPAYIKPMQLNQLGLFHHRYNSNQIRKILKTQKNLKELWVEHSISGDSFKWICENMSKLEKFSTEVKADDIDDLKHLDKLENLQYFKTGLEDSSKFNDVKNNTIKSLVIEDSDDSTNAAACIENSFKANFGMMARNCPRLTDFRAIINTPRQIFAAFYHFKNLEKFTGWIAQPTGQLSTTSIYPNIKVLCLLNEEALGELSLIFDVVSYTPNLEYLSINMRVLFEPQLIEKFIGKHTKLKCVYMKMVEFKDDFVFNDQFVKLLRRLDDHWAHYKLTFETKKGEAYLRIMTVVLSKQFKVRINGFHQPSSFTMTKGSVKMMRANMPRAP